jgi:hypothetical protein
VTAAARKRLQREREDRGDVVVPNVVVPEQVVAALEGAHLLDSTNADQKDKIAAAIERALLIWSSKVTV